MCRCWFILILLESSSSFNRANAYIEAFLLMINYDLLRPFPKNIMNN